MSHDEAKLPKWAQNRLTDLRHEIQALQSLKQIHAILCDRDRDWFTIRNIVADGMDHNNLWVLHANNPQPVCSLGRGDVLFVGRATKIFGDDK